MISACPHDRSSQAEKLSKKASVEAISSGIHVPRPSAQPSLQAVVPYQVMPALGDTWSLGGGAQMILKANRKHAGHKFHDCQKSERESPKLLRVSGKTVGCHGGTTL